MSQPIPRRAALLAVTTVALILTAGAAAAPATAPYVGQADVHGDRIVFTAEDDLWSCDRQGGDVRRLTSHVGREIFPHVSPDGRRIAFTGEYDGNGDVYVIPLAGGEPERLTWHPGADEVVGWLDGGDILLRSRRHAAHGWRLYRLDPAGGDPRPVPLGMAARLDADPDSGRWVFQRTERERRTWKRYRGGTASDLWVGHPDRGDYRRVTSFAGQDAFPMWHDGEVVFLSDQGGTANLWRMAPDGTGRTPLTDFTTWDVRWPAMGPDGTVVFTVGADLHRYDPATDEVVRIAVDLPSDRVLTRTRYRAGGKDLQGLDLAPDGERLLVEVRGELFSVPVKEGVTLPVTRGTGARERGASYGAEGKRVYFWSDAGREDALHRKDAWGRGEAEVIREGEAGPWPYALHPSPDGDWLAWVDSDDDLRVMPAGGGQARVADHGEHRQPRHLAWSPDGRWLAYVKALANKQFSIFVYDTEAGEAHAVTDRWTEDHSPAWDPDGRYLYFVSGRAHNPVLGNLDFQNVEVRHEKLYALLLTADAPHPLRRDAGLPPAAETEEEGEDAAEDPGEDPEGGDDPAPVTIDLEGIASRVVELPVDFGDHAALQATASHLFFVSNPLQGMAEGPEIFAEPEPRAVLMSYSLEDREATPFVAGISAYDLEPGAGKLAVMKRRGQVFVVDAAAPPGEALAEGKVDLGDAVVELDPRAEWAQVYWEAWRQMRAFYWDPGLGGLDWPAIGERYATLLPRLTSRADLGDLVGQLYGEASTSHSYVFGGDPGKQVPRVPVGLLGAELEREDDAYRIARILRGDPADRVRSPLDEPGADADAGDYILAVAGRPVADAPNLHALLAGLAGKQVLLTVADDPGGENRREVLVTPLRSDRDLRYVDWVRRNREYVAAQTDGKIGYVHVPDMSKDGLIAFNKWFYPQLDREGMIVDVRFNGGGFVSQMLLERLRRPLLAYDRTRSGAIDTYPARTLNGPFVVLTNQNAGSDGDIFPQAVQLEGLAPVIGTRSWGGVVGITGLRPLQDGGLVTQPMVAWWDPREGWGVENHGVEPDIEVQNLPQDEARGVDAQLDRGIAEVLRLHAAEPPQEPDFGPVPPRTREAYRDELR